MNGTEREILDQIETRVNGLYRHIGKMNDDAANKLEIVATAVAITARTGKVLKQIQEDIEEIRLHDHEKATN